MTPLRRDKVFGKLLIRDLMVAACDVLQHDTDILDGVKPYEVWAREQLEDKFTKALTHHQITTIHDL